LVAILNSGPPVSARVAEQLQKRNWIWAHLPKRVQRWTWNAIGEAQSREFDRQWAVACCGLLNENAVSAHAALLRACKDRNPAVRYEAVRTLLRTGVPVEQALPALTERMLHDSTSEVRWSAAFYIGLLEEKAEPALPALRLATNDQGAWVAGHALEALEKVEAALAQNKSKREGK
jgi:HEAT repeat protein